MLLPIEVLKHFLLLVQFVRFVSEVLLLKPKLLPFLLLHNNLVFQIFLQLLLLPHGLNFFQIGLHPELTIILVQDLPPHTVGLDVEDCWAGFLDRT